jgi:hypothetical protein
MTTLLLLAQLSFGAPLPPVDLTWITQGWLATLIVGPSFVPSQPGRSIAIWLPEAWVVTIAVNHPTRSGYLGLVAAPGVCYEPWRPLQILMPGVWHIRAEGDVTGDGNADFTFYTETGLMQVYPGTGGVYCR